MAKFEMDTDFIRKLAAILEETKLGEIEMADGERRIRVARPTTVAAAPIAVAPAAVPAPASPPAAPSTAPAAPGDVGKHPGAVKSPMVGTAYLAPEPGKPVFVHIGDKVTAGQTLLIIEAMKTFNPIKAPKAGTISQILIENARPVEIWEAPQADHLHEEWAQIRHRLAGYAARVRHIAVFDLAEKNERHMEILPLYPFHLNIQLGDRILQGGKALANVLAQGYANKRANAGQRIDISRGSVQKLSMPR